MAPPTRALEALARLWELSRGFGCCSGVPSFPSTPVWGGSSESQLAEARRRRLGKLRPRPSQRPALRSGPAGLRSSRPITVCAFNCRGSSQLVLGHVQPNGPSLSFPICTMEVTNCPHLRALADPGWADQLVRVSFR